MSIIILAIETSCDETSASVIKDGKEILSNIITSQIPIHQKFGGVVPEIASRKHIELVNGVIKEALDEAEITFNDINAVAVTYGPGLVGALLVGVSAAKSISLSLDIPLIGVNHIEGHIFANFLEKPDLKFPLVCLVVSGGHTDLVALYDYGNYEILGRTRDDAAGEAFDKIARALGLGYPGGPLIEKQAQIGNCDAYELPKAYLEADSLDFSFSGLKSAVLNLLNKANMKNEKIDTADMAASFQKAVVDVLVDKTIKAAKKVDTNTVILAGGVAANRGLREKITLEANKNNLEVNYPSLILCTDNAAMIGCVAYYKYIRNEFSQLDLNAVPNLFLGQKKC
jgi:N6-L-threonylcarbamoyladenine synthase